MSPHVYRCRHCGIATPEVATRTDAERLQALHRAAFHPGEPLDVIEETPAPSSASGWWTAAVLLALMSVGAVTLAVAWLRRHL